MGSTLFFASEAWRRLLQAITTPGGGDKPRHYSPNAKFEARNPKQIPIPKFKIPNAASIRVLCFEIVQHLGFGVWDLSGVGAGFVPARGSPTSEAGMNPATTELLVSYVSTSQGRALCPPALPTSEPTEAGINPATTELLVSYVSTS